MGRCPTGKVGTAKIFVASFFVSVFPAVALAMLIRLL